MTPNKSDVFFALRISLLLSLVLLALFNPSEAIQKLSDNAIKGISYHQDLKDVFTFELIFKKIFLK